MFLSSIDKSVGDKKSAAPIEFHQRTDCQQLLTVNRVRHHNNIGAIIAFSCVLIKSVYFVFINCSEVYFVKRKTGSGSWNNKVLISPLLKLKLKIKNRLTKQVSNYNIFKVR